MGEMMSSDYASFFERLVGREPYDYQRRLAGEPWPELVDVPTGMGKTAAVGVAWLWKRWRGDGDTPRRLVYCLPMRSLVEQTHRVFGEWLERLEEAFGERPGLHLLMGGEADESWEERPEAAAVLVGTQDMLLSRALHRGYGLSPYRWPMSFGLLHADSLWVFDEVQLMGPGIATSAQLEGLRRQLPAGGRPARSLWLSATLSRDWLATVDLPREVELARLGLGDRDREQARDRLHAAKSLSPAASKLTAESAKSKAKAYLRALSDEVLAAHRPGTRTLVILDRVDRAQGLDRRLRESAGAEVDVLLLHSRFRRPDRQRLEERLRAEPAAGGQIVVATQVVEAGVDVSARILFTELCPWSSFVQRCGRCNRYGEHNQAADAEVRWIEVAVEDDASLALPYEAADLQLCRQRLAALRSASPVDLPAVDDQAPETSVLRRRDLLDLFSTEADLSGFHVDVGPFIRDADDRQVQVFWRRLDASPAPDESGPRRDELCAAPLAGVRELVAARPAWRWDPLAMRPRETRTGAWVWVRPADLYPGLQVLLPTTAGGYHPEVGFDPSSAAPVEPGPEAEIGERPEAAGSDRGSRGAWVPLVEHLRRVETRAAEIAETVGIELQLREPLRLAARWHDVGKAHRVFQDDLLRGRPDAAELALTLWAKSEGGRSPGGESGAEPTGGSADAERSRRRYFRHELASALLVLAHRPPPLVDRKLDLVAYLVAAHHGKVRTALRAWPEEPPPPRPGARYARGVWEGDVLPPVELPDGTGLPETVFDADLLAVMEVGSGAVGRSWSDRVEDLLAVHGPFRLAYLEALLRAADWRASAEERSRPSEVAA